jgi:hypothetical protein
MFCAQVATVKSSLWQSALKFILLSMTIRATVILFLAIRVLNATDCHNPRHTFDRGTWQETEFSSRHFTSRVPHRYLMIRLSLQVFYLWRHVSSTAPPFILWWSNLEILFGPLHRSSLFIGELRCQAIQMEHGVKRCFIFTHYYSHNVYSEKTNLNLEARMPLRCRLS